MEYIALVNEMLLMMSGDIESNPGPSKYFYCVLFRPTPQGWSGRQEQYKKLHNSQLFRGCEAAKKPYKAWNAFHHHFQLLGRILVATCHLDKAISLTRTDCVH